MEDADSHELEAVMLGVAALGPEFRGIEEAEARENRTVRSVTSSPA